MLDNWFVRFSIPSDARFCFCKKLIKTNSYVKKTVFYGKYTSDTKKNGLISNIPCLYHAEQPIVNGLLNFVQTI